MKGQCRGGPLQQERALTDRALTDGLHGLSAAHQSIKLRGNPL